MLTVAVPIRIQSTQNLREHHMVRARRAKTHRQSTWLALKTQASAAHWVPAFDAYTITLIRVAPRPIQDDDNLVAGFKACRDGVADFLKLDDGDKRIRWEYRQERGAPKSYAVRVQIVGSSLA